MDLAELIFTSREYLAHFTYAEYPDHFAAFSQNVQPYFDDLSGADLQEQTKRLIEVIDQRLAGMPRREKKESTIQIKQVMALFLGPSALRYGQNAVAFAQCLCQSWNEKYPRNAFYLGDFDTLMKGFDANFLGITLRKYK
ncbi:MAG: hypothetical protein IJ662_06385 [Clostridia bacterium]|nr:hypothetical protein [Clostridia bacterium]